MRTIEQNRELLEDVYRKFVESEFINVTTVLYADRHQLSEQDRLVLANSLDLLFFLVLTPEETVDFLDRNTDLQTNQTKQIIDGIFATLPEGLDVVLTDITHALRSQTTPEELPRDKVKPLRTMATDIEKIHGYGAGTSSASEATTSQKAPQQDEEPVHTSSQESVLTHSTDSSPHRPAAPQPTQHVQPSTSNAAPVAEPAQPTPRPTAAAPSFTPTPPTTPTAPVPPAAPTSVAGTPPAPASPPTDLPTSGGNDMPSFTPTHTAPPAPRPRTDETGPAAPDTTPPDTRWG